MMSDEQRPNQGKDETPDERAADAVAAEQPSAVSTARRPWRERLRTRGALIGAGAALLVVTGLGGFALGHAVAGDDHDLDRDRHGPTYEREQGPGRGELPRGVPGVDPNQPVLPPDESTPQDGSSESSDGSSEAS